MIYIYAHTNPIFKGLIPKVCEDMFVRITNNKEERLTYTVEVSFMEIYNETVKDLLNPKNNKKVI